MDTEKDRWIILLITTLAVVILVGCPGKVCISPDRVYLAIHQIQIPDTISIGDTIFLTSEMDCNRMQNQINSIAESYCGENFSFPIVILKCEKLDSIYECSGAVDKFIYTSQAGKIFNDPSIPSPQSVNQIEYNSQNNVYSLSIGFIPLERGFYTFGLSNGGAFGNDYCDRATLINKINDNPSNTELLFRISNKRERNEDELSKIFCFEVQ